MALPQPGELFESRYRLDEILGAGGFATVYKATDVAASRTVAIKVLRPDLGGYPAQLRSRFEREVRIVANLRDQHTLTLFDHGVSSAGLLYMVTEYVGGEDLKELLDRRGRLEPAEVVHILRQVLTSLHEAHIAGLLHRDIKPSNIRVYSYMGDDLRVMLLDFGIAKEVKDHDRLTKEGELVGTLRYMSPEQLMSEPIGPPSDIYSLGVVAFELLLGSSRIHGNRMHDQLDRLATGHVFSVPELQRLGPLAPVLDRMTARQPSQRFQSAAQVLTALDAPRPAQRQPIPPPRSLPPSTAENPVQPEVSPPTNLLVGAGAVVVLALIAAVLTAALAKQEPAEPVVPSLPPSIAVSTPPAEPPPTPHLPPRVVITPTVDLGVLEASPRRSEGCDVDPGFDGMGDLRAIRGLDVQVVPAYVPRSYDPTTPTSLVVMLHENAESPNEFIRYSGMREVANRHGFVIVAPNGGFPYSFTEEEATVALIDAAIGTALGGACIDPQRVFLIGHGSGGRAAELAAGHLEVRAIATTSHRDNVGEKVPDVERIVPYLHIAPLKDKYNKVEGGKSCEGPLPYLSLAEQEKRWRERNKCDEKLPDWLHHGKHRCYAWSCAQPFVSCHLDGGRNWPGLPDRQWDYVNCDGTPANFPYAETIWKFFEEQSALE